MPWNSASHFLFLSFAIPSSIGGANGIDGTADLCAAVFMDICGFSALFSLPFFLSLIITCDYMSFYNSIVTSFYFSFNVKKRLRQRECASFENLSFRFYLNFVPIVVRTVAIIFVELVSLNPNLISRRNKKKITKNKDIKNCLHLFDLPAFCDHVSKGLFSINRTVLL